MTKNTKPQLKELVKEWNLDTNTTNQDNKAGDLADAIAYNIESAFDLIDHT